MVRKIPKIKYSFLLGGNPLLIYPISLGAKRSSDSFRPRYEAREYDSFFGRDMSHVSVTHFGRDMSHVSMTYIWPIRESCVCDSCLPRFSVLVLVSYLVL